jgi:hypothetical protein
VSLISERVNGLETFIQKVFLLRFRWERETSSRIDRHVTWVEETRLKIQRLRGDMRPPGKIPLFQ